ncbi:lipoprotein-anchoring transpeptidase ErfK/SrfK [Actinomadura pelletieri DSM 43383]|uniref:Lipoprotein-anchoring transpeptidase ErfK/SrfK n=1 Tax=Actinomadura pelletieri DSM 43383 TaxID=1120940 RepID=A0A495R0S0_9ACTN|nr:Ig-like domain-containing protein [Actinomadura pelletieri]RKS79824.1 lipoprotein-anchoring transpeptidase ErfK/SrfK [Actinomadura pelletieri DSM 43383]
MRGKALAMALVLGLATACGGGGGDSGGGTTTKGGDEGTPQVTITPANGDGKARPDTGVTVKASGGTLGPVSVKLKGADVPGALSADKTTWRSTWTLKPGGSYEVSATATSPTGKTTTATSAFRTSRATAATRINNVVPSQNETVGTGMPVFVQFNKAVPEKAKAAVERSIEISSTTPTEGSWRWLSPGESFNGLPSVVFRPARPWKPHQKVTVTVHYAGLKIGDNVFGDRDVTRTFRIGDSHTINISAKTHRAVVKKNGRVIRTWPVSLGKGGDVQRDGVDHLITTSGVHLTMDRSLLERMRPPGKKKGDPGWYDEKVPWATRISNSGEYIHQNMDDPSCLGRRNCSHGCVRSPSADAQWFYNWSYRGDIVTITGTNRPLTWWNGWGYWQLPFTKWTKGSALGKPITTTPHP